MYRVLAMPKLNIITKAAATSEDSRTLSPLWVDNTKTPSATRIGPEPSAGLLYPREMEALQAVNKASNTNRFCVDNPESSVSRQTAIPANKPKSANEVFIRMPNQRLAAIPSRGR